MSDQRRRVSGPTAVLGVLLLLAVLYENPPEGPAADRPSAPKLTDTPSASQAISTAAAAQTPTGQAGYIDAGSVICSTFLVDFAISRAIHNETVAAKPMIAARVINDLFLHPEKSATAIPGSDCIRLKSHIENITVLSDKGLPTIRYNNTTYYTLYGAVKYLPK